LAEENVRKIFVIVLPGVNQNGCNLGVLSHLSQERRDFWQVGTRTYDVEDFQPGCHNWFVTVSRGQYSTWELGSPRGIRHSHPKNSVSLLPRFRYQVASSKITGWLYAVFP
jgi:hypothetical protein